jgi:hypothetical protein
MELRPAGIVLMSPQNLVVLGRDGAVKQQAYHPAPKLPGLLRALYAVNAVRAGLRGAAASAYGEAFAQASRDATDPNAKKMAAELSTAFNEGGAQLQQYAGKSAAMATKRFKASLTAPGSVFMLTNAPDGKGNVLLQLDKESAQARSRVELGKEREPVYAVDDIAGMLFLQTAPGTLVGIAWELTKQKCAASVRNARDARYTYVFPRRVSWANHLISGTEGGKVGRATLIHINY